MIREQQKKWDLIDKFDYEAIAAYMNAVGWKYRDKDVDAYYVKETALYTLYRAIELAKANPKEEQSVACGGFIAQVMFYCGHWSMDLTFSHKQFA